MVERHLIRHVIQVKSLLTKDLEQCGEGEAWIWHEGSESGRLIWVFSRLVLHLYSRFTNSPVQRIYTRISV